jgi:hypothetical protein
MSARRLKGLTGASLTLMLAGCSASFSFGPPGGGSGPPPAAPASARVIVEPTGQVVTAPLDPIETVIEGLSQAQTVRTLTRQLAR